MLDYILEFDRELLLYLNNLGQEPWDGFWFAVTNKWSSIPLYVLLLFLMAKGLGKKRGIVASFVPGRYDHLHRSSYQSF
jgi:undecaprenyl-diphosphatase